MSWYISINGVQVVSSRKYSHRKAVPKYTSERDETMKMLVNSCKRDINSIGDKSNSCAEGPREGWRYAASKFTRAISMKMSIEDRLRGNTAGDKELEVSVRGGELMRRRGFEYTVKRNYMCEPLPPPFPKDTYSIRGRTRHLYMDSICEGKAMHNS